MDKILLFIPAYNCEDQIKRVLGQLDPAVMAFISKVIVVNNQSTDDTEAAVLDYIHAHANLPITLLRNRENYGLGGSHKVAFSYAIDSAIGSTSTAIASTAPSSSEAIERMPLPQPRSNICMPGRTVCSKNSRHIRVV